MAGFEDLHTYRQMLRVNRHRLDEELELQAEMQERIGRMVAKVNSYMLEQKKGLEATEAEVIDDLKSNDSKLSNPVAEKEARRSKQYTAAWRAYQVARQDYEEWAALYEAWKQRGYSMRGLADLYRDQYFAVTYVNGANQLTDRELLNKARQALAPKPKEEPPPPTTSVRRRPIT